MLELLNGIREVLKGYTPKWDVDYFYYNNGQQVDFDFSTTIPNQPMVIVSVPYEEGDNLSHVGIKLMDYLSDHEDKYPEDETAFGLIQELALHINQSY